MVILLLIFLSVVFTRTLSEDVPEFQYPCYVDVCTFPTQFCNSDKYERRCSPCSRSICRAANVPLACRYICMKHNELTTTTRPKTTTAAPQQPRTASQGNESLGSLHLIMSYSAISTTLLVVVLLAFVAYYIHRKKESKEKRNSSVNYRPNQNRDHINFDHLQENAICKQCGQRPRPEIANIRDGCAPPSYTSQNNEQIHLVASRTESNGSSTDSGNISTKTQRVKPMKTQLKSKVNNFNETGTRRKNVTDTATEALESLIDSRETGDIDETSRKSSDT